MLRGWTVEILRCNNRGLNNNYDEMESGLIENVQKEPRTENDSKEEMINANAGKTEVEVLDAAKA